MKTAQQYDWNKWQDVKPELPEQGKQEPLPTGQTYGPADIDTGPSLIHPYQPLYDFIEQEAIPSLGNTQEVLMNLMQSIPSEFFPEQMEGQWPEEMYENAFEAVTVLKDWLETKVPSNPEEMDKAYENLRNELMIKRYDQKQQRDKFDPKGITQAFRKLLSQSKYDPEYYVSEYEKAAERLLNIGVTTFNPIAQKQYINKAADQYGLNPLRLYNAMMAMWAKWNENKFDKQHKKNPEAILQMFNETWPTPDEFYKLCQRYKVDPSIVISMFTAINKMDETRWQTMKQMIDNYIGKMDEQRILDWMSLLFGVPAKQVADTYKYMKANEQFG